MTLRIISGVMAATSCCIASFRQSLSCLSKVWYPTVNCFLIRNSLPSTKRKADAKCTLCCYRRPAIFVNSSTIKARCSPNHAMVYTENGTYTAVRWCTPHHCTRSPPEAMPLPNWGVLSAAPCISTGVDKLVYVYKLSCRRQVGRLLEHSIWIHSKN